MITARAGRLPGSAAGAEPARAAGRLGRRGVVLLGLSVALVLTACTTTGGVPEGQKSAPPNQAQPGESGDGEPTCTTIIPDSLVKELKGLGMKPMKQEFRIGPTLIEGGVMCVWGGENATDNVQSYGWAQIDSALALETQNALVNEGWIREEENGVVFITAAPEFAGSTDEAGYGMTYAYGEDWVKVADTKQQLSLVSWPR